MLTRGSEQQGAGEPYGTVESYPADPYHNMSRVHPSIEIVEGLIRVMRRGGFEMGGWGAPHAVWP